MRHQCRTNVSPGIHTRQPGLAFSLYQRRKSGFDYNRPKMRLVSIPKIRDTQPAYFSAGLLNFKRTITMRKIVQAADQR